MKIKNHGMWQRYTPAKLPENAPANTIFVRRAGDGVDWYNYVNSGKNFAADTVKLTIIEGSTVGAATRDPTALFPSNATVLEISEAPAGDLEQLFSRKVYDADTGAFRDPPPFKLPPDRTEEILRRLEALEAKK